MDMNNDFIDGMRDVHNPVPNREPGQISDESYRYKVNINNYQTVAQAIHPVNSAHGTSNANIQQFPKQAWRQNPRPAPLTTSEDARYSTGNKAALPRHLIENYSQNSADNYLTHCNVEKSYEEHIVPLQNHLEPHFPNSGKTYDAYVPETAVPSTVPSSSAPLVAYPYPQLLLYNRRRNDYDAGQNPYQSDYSGSSFHNPKIHTNTFPLTNSTPSPWLWPSAQPNTAEVKKNSKLAVCKNCLREYTGKCATRNLKRHTCKPMIVPCDVSGCEKTFRRSDAVLNHKRNHHPELGIATAKARPKKHKVAQSMSGRCRAGRPNSGRLP